MPDREEAVPVRLPYPPAALALQRGQRREGRHEKIFPALHRDRLRHRCHFLVLFFGCDFREIGTPFRWAIDGGPLSLADDHVQSRYASTRRNFREADIVGPGFLREFELLADIGVECHEQQSYALLRLVRKLAVIRIVGANTIGLAAPRHDVQTLACCRLEAAA